MPKSVVIIPARNGGEKFRALLESLNNQTYQPDKRLVIDSLSEDDTALTARSNGCEVISVHPEEFKHGATRQWGVDLCPDYEWVIFLTQDAILAGEDSVKNLLDCLKDPQVGAAYGRQLPDPLAGPIAAHARIFNYPDQSVVKSMADAPLFGIKTAFFSNSFAAYKRPVLMAVGGFPSEAVFGEDTYVAGKMLLAGWKIAYCAAARVYHSHEYRLLQEFKRYFDIGVFHSREPWFIQSFGKIAGEGKRFFISEINYVRRHNFFLIGAVCLRTVVKLFGYHLGRRERYLPRFLKRKLNIESRVLAKGALSVKKIGDTYKPTK
ncbi:MAG: glycosyltransferase [Firmicutes bacterium]|nr:glycosyltransferase [Bacillota bacterium]